jgi:predicted RNA binding protein YcfA (HicA-like mRNA interferase family)
MTGLPAVRPDEVIAVLRKIGYEVDHQTGSHSIMYRPGSLPITVPRHNRDLKKGMLHQILRSAGLSADEFVKLR